MNALRQRADAKTLDNLFRRRIPATPSPSCEILLVVAATKPPDYNHGRFSHIGLRFTRRLHQ